LHAAYAGFSNSSILLLVDLIEANPKTKFILFHGGFPWVGETGVIVMRHGAHVRIDSVWLPTLSYTAPSEHFTNGLR
jgi:predicted TIM-barrel fold metal-dependent hydrolase